MSVRTIPWLLALAALVSLLGFSQFAVWPVVLAWLVVLAAIWVVSQSLTTTRGQRIGIAVGLLPILFLLAFEGGWYLIPADLAWLAVELTDRWRSDARPSRLG
jgi:hypothetical protein